jgi:LmbE family N-acetylglucosaminyl deacetylase
MNLFDRPLFVGAHVDDVELFAGGTLHRFGIRAKVLAFSRHRGVYESPKGEFEHSMVVLGIGEKMYKTFDLQACQPGEASMAWNRDALYDTLVQYKSWATVVITHQSTDTNQDHKQVHDEVLRAMRGMPVICGSFPHNDIPTADRRFFVELEELDVSRKVQAIASYESQIRNHRPYFDEETVRAHCRYWGSLIGKKYAEAFEVMRMWI